MNHAKTMYEIYKYKLAQRKTGERKLMVFERKILGKTFRPVKAEEAEGGVDWR